MLNTKTTIAVKDRAVLPRVGWRVHAAGRSIGMPGYISLGLLLVTVLFYFAAVRPLEGEFAALRNSVAALELRQSMPQETAQSQQSDPVRQLQEFYKFFPQAGQVSDDLAKLHAVAATHRVQLQQGNYRMVEDRRGKLLMYEISLPVKGEYSQLRKFMSQALTDIPHLGLDSVLFQRQKVGETMLESQIKFTLYLSEAV